MIQITTAHLKNGDQLFQRNVFNHEDINTYMSPIVYFGINFRAEKRGREITPANHVGTLYFVNGEWWVFEAKLKFKATRLIDKMNNKDIIGLYVKRYELTIGQAFAMRQKAEELIGNPYDFVSIFKQFFRQLFNLKVDLETSPTRFKNKKGNCSEDNAIQLEAAGYWFNNTKSVSPADLWLDQRSVLIGYLKLII